MKNKWPLFAALAFALLLVASTYIALGQRKTANDFAVAANAAPDKITALFRNWKATTHENGGDVQWSGANTQLVWIERRGPWATAKSEGDASWVIWAKRTDGSYFHVAYGLRADLTLIALDDPQRTTLSSLKRSLVENDEFSLLKGLEATTETRKSPDA